MLTKDILFNGREGPLPERIPLQAGPLELFFEEGDLRTVRLYGREILRRVYVAVRDRNWGTIPARLSNLSLRTEKNAFEIDFDVDHRQGEIDFSWHGALRGTPDGRISFSMDGAAHSSFEKNRIGFCVLFPAGCSGQPAFIEHVDGSREESLFPKDICADQPVRPFENMRAVTLPLSPLGEIAVRFEGDVFEMEDQRLWTDASYKVFCTPLALPYPAKIQAGTRVFQEIILVPKLTGTGRQQDGSVAKPGEAAPLGVGLPPDAAWKPMPVLGLGMASHAQPLSDGEIRRLKALNLGHLRVDLRLADPGYTRQLERAAAEVAALGIGLEMALLISMQEADDELMDLRARLDQLQPPVRSWLIYPSNEFFGGGPPIDALLRAARQHLENYRPGTPFCAGTNTDFVFLKRTPVPLALIDRICIALNPQVHAFDNLSLLETLEAQPMVVESARKLSEGLPVVVSPITLKPRFNAYASGPQPDPMPETLPAQVDPRQRSLFGAGWTFGSLRAMIVGETVSATYYETTGWRGVMERDEGSPWPAIYPTLAGIVYPLYHVLADMGEFEGGQAALIRMNGGESDDPRVSGLALRLGKKMTILLANHSLDPQCLALGDLTGAWSVRTLDEANAEIAMSSPEDYRQKFSEINHFSDLIIPALGYVRMDRLPEPADSA